MLQKALFAILLSISISALAQEETLTLPNIITPNNEGKNDRFVVGEFTLDTAPSLLITDRWGKTIYQTSRYLNEWDAEQQPAGIYFYSIHTQEDRKYVGQITVVR